MQVTNANETAVQSAQRTPTITQDVDALIQAYKVILDKDKQNNWARGDIAIEVSAAHDEMLKINPNSDLINEFLTKTGENAKSFISRRWVTSQYPAGEARQVPLPWTFYRTAAKSENPQDWLVRAYHGGWSVKQLIEQISDANARSVAAGGKECDCGCKNVIEESKPIYVGGVEKSRRFFYSIECLLKFYNELKVNREEAEVIARVSDKASELIPSGNHADTADMDPQEAELAAAIDEVKSFYEIKPAVKSDIPAPFEVGSMVIVEDESTFIDLEAAGF